PRASALGWDPSLAYPKFISEGQRLGRRGAQRHLASRDNGAGASLGRPLREKLSLQRRAKASWCAAAAPFRTSAGARPASSAERVAAEFARLADYRRG